MTHPPNTPATAEEIARKCATLIQADCLGNFGHSDEFNKKDASARILAAITEATAEQAKELAKLKAVIENPVAVRANILRGTIKVPEDLVFLHDTHGPVADIKRAHEAELTALRAENERLRIAIAEADEATGMAMLGQNITHPEKQIARLAGDNAALRAERDALKIEYESRAAWILKMNEIIGYNNSDGMHSSPDPFEIAKGLRADQRRLDHIFERKLSVSHCWTETEQSVWTCGGDPGHITPRLAIDAAMSNAEGAK